jgi:heme oxygenase
MDNQSTKTYKEMSLSIELKEGTKQSHSAAENTKFVSSFLRGVVDKEQYKQLIANFYFVYRAMEEEIEKRRGDSTLGKLFFTELNRVPALEQDLRYFYGPIWRSIVQPTDQCQRYVNRIREVAEDDPELLIAHHYTRYIGDLSGGQILKKIAERTIGTEGLNFYEFPNITDKKGFKASYKTMLDTLDLDQHQINAIIVEANYAFRLNMYMFDELQGSSWLGFLKYIMGRLWQQ